MLSVPLVLLGGCSLLPGKNPGLQQLAVLVAILIMVALGYVGLSLRGQRRDHFRLTGGAAPADATGLEFLRGSMPMLVGTLVVVYVTASFSEEVIYRAFLIKRIAKLGTGTAWMLALGVSSVAFGLAHFSWGPGGIVQTAFMGLGLGIAYLVFEGACGTGCSPGGASDSPGARRGRS